MSNLLLESGSGALTQESGSYFVTEDTTAAPTGSGAASDPAETTASSGSVSTSGSGSAQDASETPQASGSQFSGTGGSGAATDSSETYVSSGTISTQGSGSLVDSDTLTGSGSSYAPVAAATGDGSMLDLDEIFWGTGHPIIGGYGRLQDPDEAFLGLGDGYVEPYVPPPAPSPVVEVTSETVRSGSAEYGISTSTTWTTTITTKLDSGSGSGSGSGGTTGSGGTGYTNPLPDGRSSCISLAFDQYIDQNTEENRVLQVGFGPGKFLPKAGDMFVVLLAQQDGSDVFITDGWTLLKGQYAFSGDGVRAGIFYRILTEDDVQSLAATPLQFFKPAPDTDSLFGSGVFRAYRFTSQNTFAPDSFQQYSVQYFAGNGEYDAQDGYSTTFGEYVCIAMGDPTKNGSDCEIDRKVNPTQPVGVYDTSNAFNVYYSSTSNVQLVNPGQYPVGEDILVHAPVGYFILRYTILDPCMSNSDGGLPGIPFPPVSNANVVTNTITFQTSSYIPPLMTKPISIAPVKRLPMPPQSYDPAWTQNNQDAILSHLNNTLSSATANPQLLMRDTQTGLTHAIEISNGQIKITPVR